VLFRIASHVLEDAPLPVALHVVPVLDDAVADGVVDGVLVDRETDSSPIQKSMSSTPFHSFRADDLASFVPITDGMMYDGSTFDA
jgi:hypothetical protein